MIEAYRERVLPGSGYDGGMNTSDLLEKLRRQPANSRYRDLIRAVERCGFVHRGGRGSHNRYAHPDYPNSGLNLQPRSGMAKAYQVEQFLAMVSKYNLDHD